MPVLAKFCGIVIRLLIDRTFGTHLHVFYGDAEMVIGVNPLRVIQGEVPTWVRDWALQWIGLHQRELLPGRKFYPNPTTSGLSAQTPFRGKPMAHAAAPQ